MSQAAPLHSLAYRVELPKKMDMIVGVALCVLEAEDGLESDDIAQARLALEVGGASAAHPARGLRP